jgi:hypothetical protein
VRGGGGVAAVAALGGGAVCAVGLAIDPDAVLRGWLAGFVFWIGFPVGALMLLLAHDLTGGRWGEVVREPLRAFVGTLPVMALMVIPILVYLPVLYPWARAEEAAHLANGFYLNTSFFIARTAVYFAVWMLVAVLAERRARVAAPGLILLAVTATFAAFDWMMSIEPDWGSSIYGMLIISGMLLVTLAGATLAAAVDDPGRRVDLGSLLIAAVLLWAYLAFMQFLIIWEEDIPAEIGWYLKRLDGGWGWLALVIAFAQGLLPFLALIWRPVRRSRRLLGLACGVLILGHLLECWWLVLPALGDGGFTWFAPAATVAMGGVSLAWSSVRLRAPREVRHG